MNDESKAVDFSLRWQRDRGGARVGREEAAVEEDGEADTVPVPALTKSELRIRLLSERSPKKEQKQ